MLDEKKIAHWLDECQGRWNGYCAVAEMMRRSQEGSTTSVAGDIIDRFERWVIENVRHGASRYELCEISIPLQRSAPQHQALQSFQPYVQTLLRYLHKQGGICEPWHTRCRQRARGVEAFRILE